MEVNKPRLIKNPLKEKETIELNYMNRIQQKLRNTNIHTGEIEFTSGNYDEKGSLIKKKLCTLTSQIGELGIVGNRLYLVIILNKNLLNENTLNELRIIDEYKIYGYTDFIKDLCVDDVLSKDYRDRYVQIQFDNLKKTILRTY